MRRWLVVGVLAGVPLLGAGCDGWRDAFSPRAETAARANEERLTVDRLAELAGQGKQVPLEPAAISRVARVWVDYMLFTDALAAGPQSMLRDSATALAAMWPLVSQLKWERFHEQRVARDADFTPQQVDSAFRLGDLRMFQHILFQVPPNSTAEMDARKKSQADRLLPQARSAGAGFARLATRYSEDPGSRVQGGHLGLTGRGQFVQAFEDAAWALEPGGVSPVVKSPFGYHIIRRPPLAEVRDSFKTDIEERALFRADSLYIDSITIRREIEPVKRAPDIVRQAVQDIDAARTNDRAVVKYSGGAFRVRDVARWLGALDPGVVQALPQATDEQVNQFLRVVVQRQLLIQQAESAGVTLTPDEWQMVRAQHDSMITILASVLGLGADTAIESTPRATVDDYLERVLAGQARFFPVPPFLGEVLREHAEWSVNQAGIRRAVELARGIRARADSAQRAAPPALPVPSDTGRAGGEGP